jgi:hypothetical protein
MICQTCRGDCFVRMPISNGGWARQPCPDCLGGEQHCCEGETAVNEIDLEPVIDASLR